MFIGFLGMREMHLLECGARVSIVQAPTHGGKNLEASKPS